MSGDDCRTRATKSVTVLLPCTVAVGLFGLLKKTSPAPFDAAIIGSRSRRNCESTLISAIGMLRALRDPRQFSNVGAPVTRPRVGDVNARTAFFRISCEPAPRTMFSGLILNFAAIAATSAAFTRRAVERIAARLGELSEDRVEHGLARPERILVAADADFGNAWRHERPSPAPLHGVGLVGFHASRGDECAGERNDPSRKKAAA